MAFAVMVGHGHSKMIVKFPVAAQALGEARNQIESGQTDVCIRESATGREFTLAEFAEKIMMDAYLEAGSPEREEPPSARVTLLATSGPRPV